jgi:transcription elongation factor Elf1
MTTNIYTILNGFDTRSAPARTTAQERSSPVSFKTILQQASLAMDKLLWCARIKKNISKRNTLMKNHSLRPEIQGTRAGYVIRFTCPVCAAENVIITKTPKDHFKESHEASCKQCRKRSTILTPYMNHKMDYYPVSAYGHGTTI